MWLFCLIVDVGLSVICLTFSDYGHICLTIVTVLDMPTICLKVGAKSDEFRAPDPETTNCLTIKRKSDKKRSRSFTRARNRRARIVQRRIDEGK